MTNVSVYLSPRAVTIPRAAAHCPISCRWIAAAIKSGNASGVQANAGIPKLVNAAAIE